MYTVLGTILGVAATMLAAYSLSRKDLPGRKIIMFLFIFTMYFSGGMIPYYLVVKGLGLVNSRTLMILSGAVSVYNIIIARSFLEANIPEELKDAASIDGCGNARFFAQIVVPLSKAVIAVIALYLAVSYWNSYFNAMIFLTDTDKYPLQLYLRQILLTVSESASMPGSASTDSVATDGAGNQVWRHRRCYCSDYLCIPVYSEIFCEGCHDWFCQRIRAGLKIE